MRGLLLTILIGLIVLRPVQAQLPEGKSHTNSLGMKFVRIEPGNFVRGQGDRFPRNRDEWLQRDWDESPAHKVTITNAFFIGMHEVTNAQYEKFDPAHSQIRGKDGAGMGDDEPVTFVTWGEAADFCAWLSKKEGKPYRLPTEAEWEYCCRAGTKSLYSTGDTISVEQANLGLNREKKSQQRAMPVGSYPANPWGLFDMHGNVAEWCFDWYGQYDAVDQTDPVGRADGDARVCRGWSFLRTGLPGNVKYTRCANRSAHLPDDANRCTGFRVVLGEMPKTKPLPAVIPPHQANVKQDPPLKDARDNAKPFFVNFQKEGKGPAVAKDSWGPVFSKWNHFSAVCVCPNGDVLAAWYTTVDESGRECSQAVSRLRAGVDRWDPVSSFLTVPDVNCHAPVLFCDGKRIYHFFTQSLVGWDNSSNAMRTSDDNGATWSKPRIILPRTSPDALSQPCCCIKTKEGALVLACDGDVHQDERLMISHDDGKTWKVAKGDMRQGADGKYVIHPTIFQRNDGAVLSFLRGPNPMPLETTKNLGDTWQVEQTRFPGIGTGQKATVLKLKSEAVLLCSIEGKPPLGRGTFAALSLDDGKTWPHVKYLEGPGGYMSSAQAADGTIYLIGTQMGAAAFNEAWIKEK